MHRALRQFQDNKEKQERFVLLSVSVRKEQLEVKRNKSVCMLLSFLISFQRYNHDDINVYEKNKKQKSIANIHLGMKFLSVCNSILTQPHAVIRIHCAFPTICLLLFTFSINFGFFVADKNIFLFCALALLRGCPSEMNYIQSCLSKGSNMTTQKKNNTTQKTSTLWLDGRRNWSKPYRANIMNIWNEIFFSSF